MHTLRIAGVVAALALVLLCSVLVYTTFDRYSQAGSETLLDFLITMGPIWAGAIGVAWVWLHPSERPHAPR